MKHVGVLLFVAGCSRVFGLEKLPYDEVDAARGDGRDAVADAREHDAAVDTGPPPDAQITDCGVVGQTGCPGVEACYPDPGVTYCDVAGTKLDGAACAADNECARGYFCSAPSGGVCFRICDCGMEPGMTCNQPVACGTTPTHLCRQYTANYGYCGL